jgi:hypothetical protein
MKQKLYIAGVTDLIIVLLGTIFKINHYPGAGILLTLGVTAFVTVIIPLTLFDAYRNRDGQSKTLYIITGITCLLVFTAMLFKIQHWPFAGLLMTIAVPFPYVIFLPVFVVITSRDRNFNVYNTVFVLFLLALNSVLSGLLSLNVARLAIEDSYNLPRSMNRVNVTLAEQQSKQNESVLEMKIDDLLGVIDEYQDIILKRQGIDEKIWDKNPEYLGSPDSRNVVRTALAKNAEMANGARFEKAMNALLSAANSTPEYQDLASALPGILELRENKWLFYFTEDYTAWSLTYLDGLETNLRLIKLSL